MSVVPTADTEPFLEWYLWLQLQEGQTEKKVAIKWRQGEEKDTVHLELFLAVGLNLSQQKNCFYSNLRL